MFAVDEYKFKVHELMYTDGKHKYTEREYKIDIVRGKFRITGIFRWRMPANNARFLPSEELTVEKHIYLYDFLSDLFVR